MGNIYSLYQAEEINSEEYKLPDDIDGLSTFEDEIIYYTKSRFFQVFSKDVSISTRILSMNPTCVCSTNFGTYIIGFKSGFISEFDSQMNLLTTYTLPGTFRAHNGEITQIASSPFCHLISVGTDKSMNFWTSKGLHLSTITTTGQFTSFCVSSYYIWLADTRQRMHIIDLSSHSKGKHLFSTLRSFNLPGIIVTMTPIGDGNACIASLKNGTIIIISTKSVIAYFSFVNYLPAKNICPLRVDFKTGLVSYAVVDEEGNFTLRVLEHVVKNLGKISPFFTTNSTEIIAIKNNEIVRFNRQQLEKDSVKRLPEIDLPRIKIVKCLNHEEDDFEEDEEEDDQQFEEEDVSN